MIKIKLGDYLKQVEKEKLEEILKKNRWNQKKAAEELEIHRNTLFKKLKKHNLK